MNKHGRHLKMAGRIVAGIWILINLYVWVVMSVPPTVMGALPAPLSTYYDHHRALLTKVFYRPYVWSPEGK